MGQFKQPREGTLIIGSIHSLMLGNMPVSIPESEYSKCNFNFKSFEQFGFWGGENNYNTFYPNVTKEDFNPKDEEFIEPVFRLLSKVVVNKSWNPVSFKRGNVLKDSMGLLVGQTINCDHSTDIANAVGAIKNVMWQEEYEVGDLIIPAGINGIMKVDAKANPRLARGILMEPPSVHSNSVSINFKWDKSHPDLSDDEFYSKLGTYDKDGNLICKEAVDINCYYESSFVSHGADPFAQKVKKNKCIQNPDYASKQNYSDDKYKYGNNEVDYYFFDFKGMKNITLNNTIGINNENGKNGNNNNSEKGMNEEEKKALLATLVGVGLLQLKDGKEVNLENVTEALKNLVSSCESLTTDVTNLKNELSTKEGEITQLKNDLLKNKEMATLGENHLKNMRDSTKEVYKKVCGDKVDDTIVSLIEGASLEQVNSLNKEYTQRLESLFPQTCLDCGSHKVSRGSSSPEDINDDKGKENSNDSFSSITDQLRKKKSSETILK